MLGKCMFIQTLEVLQRRIVHHYHTRVAQQACFGSPPRHVNTHTQAAFLHPAPDRSDTRPEMLRRTWSKARHAHTHLVCGFGGNTEAAWRSLVYS